MTTRGTIAAAVLAAGRGSRLGIDAGPPKPLLDLGGRPLVSRVLDAAVASGLGPVVLVVGHDADAVAAVAPPGVEVVRNIGWSEGISTSLQAALRHLARRGVVHAVVVGLADQPLVGSVAWQRLGAAYDAGAGLAVATYGGVRANPVLIGREHWPDALALTGDEGARQLFAGRSVVEVPCDDTGRPDDVDTIADLEAIEAIDSRAVRQPGTVRTEE